MKVKYTPPVLLLYPIALLLLIVAFSAQVSAQSYPYQERWKKIEQQELGGLLKNTLPLVNEIYTQAKKDNQPQQKVRALLYQSKIALITQDDKKQEAQLLARFKAEISKAQPVEKSILQSLLAGLLNEYYQNNRYKLNNRTGVEDTTTTDDFLTWTNLSFQKEITALYDASLSQSAWLIKEPVQDWSFILDTAVQYRVLRPTLHDLLTHRALNYYTGNNHQEKAESLIRNLINQHQTSADKNAYLYNRLISLNLKRKITESQKIEELKALAKLYPRAWYTSEILLQLATSYQQFQNDYTVTHKKKYLDSALAVGRLMERSYPKTQANIKLKSTITGPIISPEMNIQAEKYNSPAQAIPVYLSHKNINKLFVKVLSYNRPFSSLNNEYEIQRKVKSQADLDSLMHEHSVVQSYSRVLKVFDDYQFHSTLLNFDPLANGTYLVLLSNHESFKLDSNNLITFQTFNVSNKALVIRGDELLLTDRESGKPLKDVQIDIYTPLEYESDLKLVQNVTTNKDGIAKTEEHLYLSNNRTRRLLYKVKGDSVYFQGTYYIPRLASNYEKEEEKVQFFVDRGIYRPGQTVYFKGIIYNEKGENRQVLNNSKTTISLHDPNNGKIASIELTSNQYGSVFGSFVLPQGKLTGNYSIKTDNNRNRKSFKVEEYKRPTFTVIMDTVKGAFKIDQEVVAKGMVQAFSGASIDQAKVKYRVTRRIRSPYTYWRGINSNYAAAEEIASGETTTDKSGKFDVKFIAKPAQEKKEHFRFYNYEVNITATDINGETHEGNQTISVGDKSIVLTIPILDKINIDFLDSIPFRTANLNGQQINASGNIRITKLKSPGRVSRPFMHNSVSYMLTDSLQFIKLFPHLPYGNELNVDQWAKEKQVLNQDFDSATKQSVSIGKASGWQEGAYLLEAYVLDGIDTLRTSRLIHLFRSESKQPVDKELLRVALVKPSYKPGENAELIFSSAASNAVVLVEFEQAGKIVKREQLTLNNEVKKLSFPIGENAADQLFVHYYMGKFNSPLHRTIKIPVLQPSRDLTITTSTFRDKLQPGQEEAWELKISGADKDKLYPEVLALMYDASLDKFAANRISFPGILRKTNSNVARWNTSFAYGNVYGITLGNSNQYWSNPFIKYEDLQHFGFSFVNPTRKQNNYVKKLNIIYDDNVYDFTSIDKTTLVRSVRTLNEVTVIGYGSALKKDLTGSVAGVQGDVMIRGASSITQEGTGPLYIIDGVVMEGATVPPSADAIHSIDILKDEAATALYGARAVNGVVIITTKEAAAEAEMLNAIPVRKDLKETAFFFPDLRTDEEGNVKLRFTSPERLTEWKFMAFAHTPDLKTGYLEKTVRTSKDLMVVPNAPRFLRAGDELTLSTKVVNLSGTSLEGSAKLMFFNALTMQPLDSLFALSIAAQKFNIQKGGSTNVSWQLKVPELQQPVTYRIVAAAGNFSDGEESVLPILPNRQLVTETMSLYVKEGQKKNFVLSNLAKSTQADHVGLTLEIAANPMWYAIQALPYLQESSYQSSEQLFAKLYSSMVSKHLVDVSPKIKTVFDDWNKKNMLQSKLEINEELKMLLVEETPWVRAAENEAARMKRLSLLFDLNNLRQQYESNLQRLQDMQFQSGAFPWFEGGKANQSITTHLVAGFGHLKALKINDLGSTNSDYHKMIDKAISYLDKNAQEELKLAKGFSLSYNALYYLYARSYFIKEQPLEKTLLASLFQKIEDNKFNHSLQSRAMLALVYKRFGKQDKAVALVRSLKDYAFQSDEMGMYWKENVSGWNWWQSPIETQAVLIEAFQEVTQDEESVAQMKVWLLKNKQTNHWASSKATTEAIYALLLHGKDWLAVEVGVEVKLGTQSIDLKSATSASGYSKKTWHKSEVKPEMAKVEISKTSPGVVWGGLYWQYFEDLDKIKASANGVQLEKTLFLKKNTGKTPTLVPITKDTPIQIGEVVTVRLIIRADRDLQFMHLKDMRASGFEPINVLSSYKWQDGLGYYESTRDAATNFFIDRLPKGTYVFEYDVRANNAGSFSNGITTLQSMYAPEMGSNSEGIKVKIVPAKP